MDLLNKIKLKDIEMTAYHPFRSVAAKKEYLAFYDMRAKKWPVDSRTRSVDTSYGQTFVRMSGPVGAPPLVLLHGAGLTSSVWFANFAELSAHHPLMKRPILWGLTNAKYGHGLPGSFAENRLAGPGRIFPAFKFHN